MVYVLSSRIIVSLEVIKGTASGDKPRRCPERANVTFLPHCSMLSMVNNSECSPHRETGSLKIAHTQDKPRERSERGNFKFLYHCSLLSMVNNSECT